MALTVNFSVSSNITTPSVITLTDTSTGTDGSITSRRVYLQKADGTYLVPTGTTTDYVVWSIIDSTINIDALDVDYALNITVDWMNSTNITYTKSILAEFNAYAKTYRLKILSALARNPRFTNNPNFFQIESQLTTFIDGANESVSLAGDIELAQLCNNNSKFYIDNPKLIY